MTKEPFFWWQYLSEEEQAKQPIHCWLRILRIIDPPSYEQIKGLIDD